VSAEYQFEPELIEHLDELGFLPGAFAENGASPRPLQSEGGHSWQPLNIVKLASKPPHAPEIAGLFYKGKRHNLAGESEAAKTWLAAAAAADELKEGRGVVWVDGDLVGDSDLLERLRSFDVPDKMIASHFLYFAPEGPVGDSAAELARPLLAHGGRLAVLDGWNALLYLHGCDPDKGVGIEAFMRRVANPLRDAGAAVVMTDNVTKSREARGSWAIGSERKKSAVEVQLGMTKIEPLSRGQTGKFKLTVHKDRPGFLERPSPGLFVIASDPDSGRCTWRIEADHSADDEGAFRPTGYMERVSRHLELRNEPQSRNAIETDVEGKATVIRIAIDRLIFEEYAVEFEGARKARMVKLERVFREAEEWQE
jgi:hypothetical protein